MKHFPGTREVVEYLLPKYGSGKTLDVGAGRGRYRAFIESVVTDYKTTDIDPYEGVDYVEDATRLSFADNSFETILSFQTLEHIREPNKAVAEMHRILKEGGICIATVPFFAPEHARPTDFQRYTTEGLRVLFEQAGFIVVECEAYGGLYMVIAETIKWLMVNPALDRQYGRFRRKIAHWGISLFTYLEHSHPSRNEIFYANSYIVARKR